MRTDVLRPVARIGSAFVAVLGWWYRDEAPRWPDSPFVEVAAWTHAKRSTSPSTSARTRRRARIRTRAARRCAGTTSCSGASPCRAVAMFDLDDTTRGDYLHHKSDELGEFSLSSDAVVASFRYVPMVQDEPEQLRRVHAHRLHDGRHDAVAGEPGRRQDDDQRLARGFNRRIRDRFDLTMECIRRHYLGEGSPLRTVFARYADFFELFGDFRGFVEFFLLQDAVTVDCDAVIFSAPFSDFTTPAHPPDHGRVPGVPAARDRLHRGPQPPDSPILL